MAFNLAQAGPVSLKARGEKYVLMSESEFVKRCEEAENLRKSLVSLLKTLGGENNEGEADEEFAQILLESQEEENFNDP